MIAILCLTILYIGPQMSIINASSEQPAKVETTTPGKSTMLAMVHIRASSPGSLKRLRAMPIDIIRIRPGPSMDTDQPSLGGGVIVEAVVTRDILPKLKAAGFEIREISPK
jgi:hypothetical protein